MIRFVFMYRGLIADSTAVALSDRNVARIMARPLSENIGLFIYVPFICCVQKFRDQSFIGELKLGSRNLLRACRLLCA